MKAETRRMKLAELFGDEELMALAQKPAELSQSRKNEANSKSREAEAVLGLLSGKLFIERNCKRCERQFLTDYACVAFCSDICRSKNLLELGLPWDPNKPLEERWGYSIPLVIPPNLVDHLRKVLLLSLDHFEQTDQQIPQEIVESHPVLDEPQTELLPVQEFDLELDPSILDVLQT